jgi:hypothetical protein
MAKYSFIISIANIFLVVILGTPVWSQLAQREVAIFSRIKDAAPHDKLAVLEKGLSEIRSQKDPQGFALMVSSAFNTLYERDIPNREAAHRSEQRYLLTALRAPDLLNTDTELYLLLRLRADVSGTDAPKSEEMHTKLNLLFHGWQRMERETIRDFDLAKLPVSGVMPPDGAGVSTFTGMDPASIPDAKVRSRYEQMIAENNAVIAKYNLQYELRELRRPLIQHIVQFVRSSIRKGTLQEREILSEISLIQDAAGREQIIATMSALRTGR